MIASPRTFRFELRADGVGVLTLDDPATRNALRLDTYAELGTWLPTLADERELRALVVTGAGGAFSSGGHVHEIIGKLVTSTVTGLAAFTRMTAQSVRALRALPQPVIAAIGGVAVGGGAALALAADLRFASADARIGFVFPRVGLSAADMGVTWLLPRIVGTGRAMELLLTGDLVDADEALRIGLVNRVHASDRLLPGAIAYAARLASGPAAATAATKRMVDRAAVLGWDDALEEEAAVQAACMDGEEFREAYRAIKERRAPRFRP